MTTEDCAKFNTSVLSFVEKFEICAANKIQYPVMKVYIRKKIPQGKRVNGKKYAFMYIGDRRNTVSMETACFLSPKGRSQPFGLLNSSFSTGEWPQFG